MRSVSFSCPVCGRAHYQEMVRDRQTECEGQAVYFTSEWEPTLDRRKKGKEPPSETSVGLCLFMFVLGAAFGFFMGRL